MVASTVAFPTVWSLWDRSSYHRDFLKKNIPEEWSCWVLSTMTAALFMTLDMAYSHTLNIFFDMHRMRPLPRKSSKVLRQRFTVPLGGTRLFLVLWLVSLTILILTSRSCNPFPVRSMETAWTISARPYFTGASYGEFDRPASSESFVPRNG